MKKEKGVALITLVVAILMMLIVSSVIIFNTRSHIKMQNLNQMYNDISLLNEKVSLYYAKTNSLPIIQEAYSGGLDSAITGNYESNVFHIIDLNKMDKNLSISQDEDKQEHSKLNYGADYYSQNYLGDDIYVINTRTHQIFYVKGIEMDGVTYYTIPGEEDNFKEQYSAKIDANPPILEKNYIPVKLNNGAMAQTTELDENWYEYTYVENLTKWARVVNTDETEILMWVPRFAYKKVGEDITIAFLKGATNEPIDNTNITTAGWKISDAFQTREKTQLTGRWLNFGRDYKYINSYVDLIKYLYELTGKDNTEGTENTTITGGAYSYYNPIIPYGFRTVGTMQASWISYNDVQVSGWNDGLVIEDTNGVEYVWVPMSSNAEFTSWYTSNSSKLNNYVEADVQNQIRQYGGFYVTKAETAGKISILYVLDEIDNRNGTENMKLGSGEFAYNNPVIPAGFRAVQTNDANWNLMPDGTVEGWNEGLVIQDTLGNEYVWVPVDGENVKFEQHQYVTTTANIDTNITADTGNGNWRTRQYRNYVDWIDLKWNNTTNEYEEFMDKNIISVNKYGGFYIARYEAGYGNEPVQNGSDYIASKPLGTDILPSSKKNYAAWNGINQINADIVCNRLNGETGYFNVYAGLVDSYAWDTIVSWMKNIININDSRDYGIYSNSTISDINVIYYDSASGKYVNSENISKSLKSVEFATGTSEKTKVKNIYDFGGNLWETTTEVGKHSISDSRAMLDSPTTNGTYQVIRSGGYNYGGNDYTLSSRNGLHAVTSSAAGFRAVLYVK